MEKEIDSFGLRSRVIFIDSCIYHANNYQFLARDLASLAELLKNDQASLLFVSITVAEVKKHLKAQAKEAVSAAQSFREKGRILRNIPSYCDSVMFGRVDSNDVEAELLTTFERFLAIKNIEVISVDDASAERVFERFFAIAPPFSEKKPNEFRDAFVLDALSTYAVDNNLRIHVISSDSDMRLYCADSNTLFWSNNLGEVVNALAHTVRDHPLEFADKSFGLVRAYATQIVRDWLDTYDFSIESTPEEKLYNLRFTVKDIMATNVRVFSAKADRSVHGVDFEFQVVVEYSKSGEYLGFLSDRDVDPSWQKENHKKIYKKVLEAQFLLSYFEGDLESVTLDDWEFEMVDGDFLELPISESVELPRMFPSYEN